MAKMIGKNFSDRLMEATVAPSKTIAGSSVSYNASGIWSAVDRRGHSALIKCVYVPSGINGVLNLHMADDYDGSNAKAYAAIPVTGPAVVPFIADEIKQSGTTLTLTSVIFGLAGTEV